MEQDNQESTFQRQIVRAGAKKTSILRVEKRVSLSQVRSMLLYSLTDAIHGSDLLSVLDSFLCLIWTTSVTCSWQT